MSDTLTALRVTVDDLRETFEAFNRHDIDGVMRLFAEDSVFHTVAGESAHGTEIVGRQAIADAFVATWTAMPDAQWANHSHMVDGDQGVSRWTFRGTNSEGMVTEAEGVDLFTFRGAQIVSKSAFRKQRPAFPAR